MSTARAAAACATIRCPASVAVTSSCNAVPRIAVGDRGRASPAAGTSTADHGGAVAGQGLGDRRPDAPGRAGHDRDLAGERRGPVVAAAAGAPTPRRPGRRLRRLGDRKKRSVERAGRRRRTRRRWPSRRGAAPCRATGRALQRRAAATCCRRSSPQPGVACRRRVTRPQLRAGGTGRDQIASSGSRSAVRWPGRANTRLEAGSLEALRPRPQSRWLRCPRRAGPGSPCRRRSRWSRRTPTGPVDQRRARRVPAQRRRSGSPRLPDRASGRAGCRRRSR